MIIKHNLYDAWYFMYTDLYIYVGEAFWLQPGVRLILMQTQAGKYKFIVARAR